MPTKPPSYIGVGSHRGFTMHHSDKPGDFRSWCVCECGWVSADIIGHEGAYRVWKRHVAAVGGVGGTTKQQETP